MPPKIMLVEDDVPLTISYVEEFEEEGYEVCTVQNGAEAIEKVDDIAPDLIIMDINLPKMDGIEAMWNILSNNKKIPIIINTAYSEYRDNFMTWGAEAYIVKSIDLEPLKEAVRRVVERKRTASTDETAEEA